jgi:hypothetical protein
LPWVDQYLVLFTRVRSNLTRWIGILRLGAADSVRAAALSAGGEVMRRRAVAVRWSNRVNAFSGTVWAWVWPKSKSPRRETHLEARGAATAAGDGGRWPGAARDDGKQFVSMGRWGIGEETAGENPHRNAKLLECFLDGGERWTDGAASGRGMEAAVAEELGRFRVLGEGSGYGCGLGRS